MRTRITLECTECKQRNYNTTKESGQSRNKEVLQVLSETHNA